MLPTRLSTGFTALAALFAAGSAVAAPNTTTLSLKPWEISTLVTHSPSGYPGGAPYSTLFATISDPNNIFLGSTQFGDAVFAPSSVNCTVRWLGIAGADDDPHGRAHQCSDMGHGKWTVEILPGVAGDPAVRSSPDSATTNFALRFTLTEAVTLMTGTDTVTRPVLVNQTLVETRCLAGTCSEWVRGGSS
ncbi:hypothetical protein B0T26DRAFT_863663 [Lasiosphaeria miniovina]|uniref:Secreted protein n=1 Tax=Lasiosphaeria miniovina TaxID=1954250 RepID=A0AA40DMX3_9PEZI|nr:uncharacterized protein B0T26DRAFT_863663 [Lasiosphaeria miniovina]KAK0707091.1 hypothetical protein B0T26DRAFT_863663 [Lasiosphaeria miniovina]